MSFEAAWEGIFNREEVAGYYGYPRKRCLLGGERAADTLLPQFNFNFDVMFAVAVQAARS